MNVICNPKELRTAGWNFFSQSLPVKSKGQVHQSDLEEPVERLAGPGWVPGGRSPTSSPNNL